MKAYFVYIMTNKWNTVLYTGVTNNIIRRVSEHRSSHINGFTKKYNLMKLVYYEEFGDVGDAIDREKKIKGWLRKKKVALISKVNPYFKDLYEEIYG